MGGCTNVPVSLALVLLLSAVICIGAAAALTLTAEAVPWTPLSRVAYAWAFTAVPALGTAVVTLPLPALGGALPRCGSVLRPSGRG